MPDRLSAQDVSFLYLEQPAAAMHAGTVMVFESGPGGLDLDRITRHVASRIAMVPRYRQRIRTVPGRLANPVWVDDERFDIGHHVRRSVLPKPGSTEQLAELVARVQVRPLDRDRPLWELLVVEGLEGGRHALITKVHQALVDGIRTVDLGQVILDDEAGLSDPPTEGWRPVPEPGAFDLVADAIVDSIRRPGQVVGTVRSGLGDIRDTATRTARTLGGLARVATSAAAPAHGGPLTRPMTEHRRFAMVDTELAAYRHIRKRLNSRNSRSTPITINDVVLATLAGALRTWLLTRGEPVGPGSIVRTLVPMSVQADPEETADEMAGTIGSRVASLLIDLPTGEASPLMRIHQVAYQTTAHRDTGRAIGAPALAGIAGFAPPTLHSLGARVAGSISRRMFHLVVTNVPGPQQPLYLEEARMRSTYPVVPVNSGQVLSVGLTSYDGGVFYGLNADRDAVPDLDVVGQCILEAVVELQEAVR